MSDPTAPVEGTPSTAAPEAPTGPDFSPVMDRLGELASNIDTRFQSFEQRLPQPEPEAEPDPWASLFPEQAEPDPYAQQEPQGLDPQALQAAFATAQQQAVAPLLERLQRFETQQAAQQLYSEIPQLAEVPESHPDYAVHQAVRQQTAQAVQASVAHLAPHIASALMEDPRYVATIFKAAEADKRSQAQVPASEQVPSLEAAGGAVPGGNGEPPSYVKSAHNGAWSLPPGLR